MSTIPLLLYNIVFVSGDLEVKTVDPFAEQYSQMCFSTLHLTLSSQTSNLAISLSTCMLVGCVSVCGSELKATHTIAHLLCHCDMSKV